MTLIPRSVQSLLCQRQAALATLEQTLKYLQQHLNISLPILNIKKVSGLIPVPQKSLHKLEERISNAQKTFIVSETRKFKTIAVCVWYYRLCVLKKDRR